MNNKISVAATGLSGLVGSRIRVLTEDVVDWIELNESQLDITQKDSVDSYISTLQADLFLHLAAFTNVDACENEKNTAYRVNVDGTRYLIDATQKKGIKFIYVSTGFVFDGNNPPYYEDSVPHPISYYGETKYEGEKLVHNKGMIVRIDYPYGGKVSHKKDVVESLIDALREKKPIQGITDQILTPTYIDDIAAALRHLFVHFSPSTYHIVGADSLSGMEIIRTIGEVFGIETSWVPSTTHKEFYKGKAPRPQNDILKTKNNTFYTMKTFRQGLIAWKERL